jgi:malonate-semialdehyde dehydrogenase (acetylating)/methylmalonate-semialdehyde dehydrogenase
MLIQGKSMLQVSNNYDTVTYREPVGVFAGIAPFNFPAMIPFGWMIPMAITTGNTYVVKLASYCPITGMRLMDLLHQAGCPPGVVNVVTASRNESEPLLTHPAIAGVTLVGSRKVGAHVYKTAAAHGKRVQALLEAKNHAIVLKDVPLMPAAMRIINSAFGCAGQRCMALPAVCVEAPIYDKFLQLVAQLAPQRKIGPAWLKTNEAGPLVSKEQLDSVKGWIKKGIDEGARPVLDGRKLKIPGYEGGYFLGPTVFADVRRTHRIGIDEIFGPVLSVKKNRDLEEGMEISNSSEFGNGGSIFTMNGSYSREIARHTGAGMVGINVGIPVPISSFEFCGHKESFYGDLHILGHEGVQFYTQIKSVTSHWFDEAERSGVGKKVGTWEGGFNRV